MANSTLSPGEYWFEDLPVGGSYETGRIVVTEAHIVSFAGISGDFFDVHMDDEFARSHGFAARIAHGLLGLALTDGLKNRASVRLKAVASLGWRWNFVAPILAGDRIGAVIEVADKKVSRKGKGIVTLKITVTNQKGQSVQQGETTLVVRRRADER